MTPATVAVKPPEGSRLLRSQKIIWRWPCLSMKERKVESKIMRSIISSIDVQGSARKLPRNFCFRPAKSSDASPDLSYIFGSPIWTSRWEKAKFGQNRANPWDFGRLQPWRTVKVLRSNFGARLYRACRDSAQSKAQKHLSIKESKKQGGEQTWAPKKALRKVESTNVASVKETKLPRIQKAGAGRGPTNWCTTFHTISKSKCRWMVTTPIRRHEMHFQSQLFAKAMDRNLRPETCSESQLT